MKEEKNHPSPLQSWLIWSSGGLFFLLGFFHRVAPAVLHRELTVDFSLSASSLGALTSLYYYSYTAMQIPTGLLADLWGPRRLLAFGLISTAITSGCGNDRYGIRRIPSAPGNHPVRLEKRHSDIRTSGFADGSFGFHVCAR